MGDVEIFCSGLDHGSEMCVPYQAAIQCGGAPGRQHRVGRQGQKPDEFTTQGEIRWLSGTADEPNGETQCRQVVNL